jgi:hypothetical protein
MPCTTALLLLQLLGSSSGSGSGSGSAPSVPAEGMQVLAKGDVYVNADLRTRTPEAIKVMAVVDVRAAPGVVWDVIVDFNDRVKNSWLVDSARPYADHSKDGHLDTGIRWRLSIMGSEIIYHARYAGDRAGGYMDWTVDATRDNDIEPSHGRYTIIKLPGRGAGSRLIYVFEVQAKRAVGKAIRKRLVDRNIGKLMEHVRERAEQA